MSNPPAGRELTTDAELRDLLRSTSRVAVLGIKTEAQSDQAAFYVPSYLASAGVESAEIDQVERLILVEAREHVADLARRRIAMRLQALRADLFHHALHR